MSKGIKFAKDYHKNSYNKIKLMGKKLRSIKTYSPHSKNTHSTLKYVET